MHHMMKISKNRLSHCTKNGKKLSQLSLEYGVSKSALSKWIHSYSEVKTENGDILTVKQIKELQKQSGLAKFLGADDVVLTKGRCL